MRNARMARIGQVAAIVALAELAGCAGSGTMDKSASVSAASAPPTIFIASDSTASNYNQQRYPQAGWGTFLPCALEGAKVDNRAIGGRSTRTFIGEGRWNKLLADLKAGDAVLIQFGHNDASADKPERFAAPDTTYRQNLVSFIADVKAAGATPILLTPVARRSFENGKAKADYPTYSAIVRELAQQRQVPLIDLETQSRALLDQVGEADSAALYLHYKPGEQAAFPNGIADNTHFSELGARRMANLVADGLKASGTPLANLVTADRSDLTRETPVGSSACK